MYYTLAAQTAKDGIRYRTMRQSCVLTFDLGTSGSSGTAVACCHLELSASIVTAATAIRFPRRGLRGGVGGNSISEDPTET